MYVAKENLSNLFQKLSAEAEVQCSSQQMKAAALDVWKLQTQNEFAAPLVPGDSTVGSLNEVQQINLAYFMSPE